MGRKEVPMVLSLATRAEQKQDGWQLSKGLLESPCVWKKKTRHPIPS